jgi:hypothetical protein
MSTAISQEESATLVAEKTKILRKLGLKPFYMEKQKHWIIFVQVDTREDYRQLGERVKFELQKHQLDAIIATSLETGAFFALVSREKFQRPRRICCHPNKEGTITVWLPDGEIKSFDEAWNKIFTHEYHFAVKIFQA